MSLTVQRSTPHGKSRRQIEEALTGLSNADLLRLKRIAQLRTYGLPEMNWEDLLQEAIARALAGSRVWPSEVPFLAFLVQTMRSIANEAWLSARRADVALESDFESGKTSSDAREFRLEEVATNEVDPEREAMASDALRWIEAFFAEDSDATAVLAGLAQGLSPQETQIQSGMTPSRYEAAQKRIRRKLTKGFGSRTIL